MKYSREQVKAMPRNEYESVICKELNEAGFRHEFRGRQLEYQPYNLTSGGAIFFDTEAVNYLKSVGLIDNGKCPMCSVMEDDLIYKLENSRSGVTFHVCKSCYKLYAKQEIEKRANGCCLIIVVVVVLIVWGIIKMLN